jgi:hypothetical protein
LISIRQQHLLPPEKNSATAADDLETLRHQLVHHAFALVTSLSEDIADAPLSERVMALTRLIDRLVKLDTHADSDYIEMMRLPFDIEETDDDDPAFTAESLAVHNTDSSESPA